MSIKAYIDSNYTIAWQHSQATVADWNIFLIEEDHTNKLVRATNGVFISLFATAGSFFVSESTKRLEKSKRPYTEMRTFEIQTPHIPAERIIGWDIADIVFKEPSLNAYNWVSDVLEKYHDEPELFDIDWEQTLINGFNQLLDGSDWIDPRDRMELNLSPLIDEVISTVGQEMEDFKTQAILFWKNYLLEDEKANKVVIKIMGLQSKIEYDLDDLKLDLNALDSSELTMMLELQKLKSELHSYHTSALSCKDALYKLILEKRKDLFNKRLLFASKDFPVRTQSIVTTLERVDELLVKTSDARAFLIAGSRHLEENHNSSDWSQEIYTLESLYHFLGDHKNIVILKPKNLVSL